ncbi:MAG: hypothetical protein LBS24_04495 [Clostridiales Family XIII bacterium]|jgi:hypothetical protein|nr:hypothetical protein [Clostridiales Family XIII bacterium]
MNEYYKGCAVPKPKTVRKKKEQNGWKEKPSRVCAYDGTPYAERHEVFGGPLRQISIDYGFQVDVSPARHAELHAGQTEWARAENLRLKRYFQAKLEAQLFAEGMDAPGAREAWMRLIGRNYL